MDTQVVIVGAGPVGLFLAGQLRRGGVDVTLVEKLAEPTGESRASQLNARTMEVLDRHGLVERLGALENVSVGHFGGIPLDVGNVDSHWPGFWKIPQYRTERALQEWALELGLDLRRGHELHGLRVAHDHVAVELAGPEGPVRLRTSWLVGCDGQSSTVRELAGIAFPGTDATRELWRADLSGVAIPDRRFERQEGGLTIAARRPDGITRVMLHEFACAPLGRTPTFAEFAAAWARLTGEDISTGQPVWLDACGDASRQAAQYRAGRVLLAGDAAHQQLPVGGQALNLGLQDADNLAWKLLAVLRGQVGEALLDSYHTERHPVGARTLSDGRGQAHLLLGGTETTAMRRVLAELIERTSAATRLAAAASGLDDHYGLSGGHPLVGSRLRHLELDVTAGATTSSTALLRAGRGVLIEFRSGAQATSSVAAGWAGRVDLVRARTSVPEVAAGALLLRPDGHVAWALGPDETGCDGLEAALSAWFGEPDTAAGARGATSHTATGSAGYGGRPQTAGATAPHRRTPSTTHHIDEGGRTEMNPLQDKIALVTGASRGIGRAVAERLARDGALVAVHYSTGTEAAEQTVKNIAAAGGQAFTVQARLGVLGDADAVYDRLAAGLREQGVEPRLDILVNNAGIMGGVPPEEITYEKFDQLMAVNARAPLFLVQRLLPLIPDGGRIVTISSGLTRFANPDELAYAMTKGAVEQISRHLAKHLGGRNITVNHVAPGVTNNGSPLFDDPDARAYIAGLSTFDRIGEPADVADIVAFVASPDARWMTGAFLDATGGTLLGG